MVFEQPDLAPYIPSLRAHRRHLGSGDVSETWIRYHQVSLQLVSDNSILYCAVLSYSILPHPTPSYPTLSHPVQSNPVPSNPVQSNPTLSYLAIDILSPMTYLRYRTANTDDIFGEEGWGFTPRCRMDDGERFKDCIKLECVCLVCSKISPFLGVVGDTAGNTGHNCPSCNADFFGR